jgi:hypothetical protein
MGYYAPGVCSGRVKFTNLKPDEETRARTIVEEVCQKFNTSRLKEVRRCPLSAKKCLGTWNRRQGLISLEKDFEDDTVYHELGHVVYDSLLEECGKKFLLRQLYGKRPDAEEHFEKTVRQYRGKYFWEKGYSDIELLREHNQYAARSEEQFALNFQRFGSKRSPEDYCSQ